MIAEHLESSGPCELGSLGNLFPKPTELAGKQLKDLFKAQDDVFILDSFKDSGWSVRLRRNGKAAARIAPVSNGHVRHLEKTALCIEWKIKGKCHRGMECWYAHGSEELKSRVQQGIPQPQLPPQNRTQTAPVHCPPVLAPAPAPKSIIIGQFTALSLDEDETRASPNVTAMDEETWDPAIKSEHTPTTENLPHSPEAQQLLAAEALWRYILTSSESGCVLTHGDGPGSMTQFFCSLRNVDETHASAVETSIRTCVHDNTNDGVEALAAKHAHLLRCLVMEPASGCCRITLQGACEKPLWTHLNEHEQHAAATLGYDQHLWENGLTPPVCTFAWNQLAAAERSAACLLGYCDASWNEELLKTNPGPTLAMVQAASVDEVTSRSDETERAETRSSASQETENTSQTSCKAKVDAIRKELGFSMDLSMPTVVKQGFELIGDEPPSGGLIKQVLALYAMLFE
jgi:hypothetical protein